MNMKRIVSLVLCVLLMLSSVSLTAMAQTEPVVVNIIKGDSYTLPTDIAWDEDYSVDTSKSGYQIFTGTKDSATVKYRVNVGEYKVLMQDGFEGYTEAQYTAKIDNKVMTGGTFYKSAYSADVAEKKSQQLVKDGENTVASFGKGLSGTPDFKWAPTDVAAGEAFKVSYKVRVKEFNLSEASATNYFFTNNFENTEGIHLRAKVSNGVITKTELRHVGSTADNADISAYVDWKYTDETNTVAYMDKYMQIEIFGDQNSYSVKIDGNTVVENWQWTNQNIYQGNGIGSIVWAKRTSSTAAITYADEMVYSKVVYPKGDIPLNLTDSVEKDTVGERSVNFNLEMSDGTSKAFTAKYTLNTEDTAQEGIVTKNAQADGFNFTIPVLVKVEDPSLIIDEVEDIANSVCTGDEFTLPENVLAKMKDGSTESVSITWNSAASTATPGTYTFTGIVEGYTGTVTYTLTVKNVIKKSTIVGKGDSFTLPSSYNGIEINWGATPTNVDTTYVGRQIFKGAYADGAEFVYTVNVGEQHILISDDMQSYTVGGDKPEYVGTGGLELSADGTNIVYEEGNEDNKTALISSKTSWGSFKMISPEVSKNDYIISGRFKHLTTAPSSGFTLVAYNGAGLEVCGMRVYMNSGGNGQLNIRNGIKNNLDSGANSTAFNTAGKTFENLTEKWIDFSIFVDKNTGTYDVYANGHEIRLDVPFNQSAVTDPKFKSIDIVGRTGNSNETLTYIDDLKIAEYLYVTGELPGALTDSVVMGVDAQRTQKISLKMNDGSLRQFTVKYTIDPAEGGVQNVVGHIDGFSQEIPVTVEVDARSIESIKAESLINTQKVYVGTDFVLPSSVIATMSDEDENGIREKEMNVEWEGVADTSQAGVFTFNGSVAGYNEEFRYTLTVSIDKPVSAEAISETVTLNESYSLPAEVPVTMESGVTKNMAVDWKGAAARTDEAGTQTYTGYIVVYPELGNGEGVEVSLTLIVIASSIASADYPEGKTSFDIILKDIQDLPKKVGCVYENGMKGFERVTWNTESVGEGAGPFAITGTLASTDLADGFDGTVKANVSFFNVPEPALQDGLDNFTYPFGDAMFPLGITLAYQQYPTNNSASFMCIADPDNPDNKIMKYENRPEYDRNNKFNYAGLALNAAKGGFLVTEADIKLPRNFTDTRFRLLTGLSSEFIVIDFNGDKSMKVRNVGTIENVIPLDEWFTLTLVTDTTATEAENRFYDIYINGVYVCTAPWYQEPTETNGVGNGVMRFDFRNHKDENFIMYLDKVRLYFLNDLMTDAYTAVEALPSRVQSNAINLPTAVGNTTVTWTSSNEGVISNTGAVTRPSYNAENANVTMTAVLLHQAGIFTARDTVEKSVSVIKVGATDSDLVNEAKNSLSSIPSETSADITLPTQFGGAKITWTTSNAQLIDTQGRVYPVESDTPVTLTATIKAGNASDTKTITVTVLHTETLTDLQKVRKVMRSITLPETTSQNVSLPSSKDGVTITWVSKSLSVIASDGTLNSSRPSSAQATLTATFTYGSSINETKDYSLTVTKTTTGGSENSGGGGGGGGGGSKSDYIQKAPVIEETPVITVGKFSDLSGYEWAKDAIEELSDKGIINGVGNKSFAPSSNIKREEFAAMMVRLAKIELTDIENPFSDVAEDAWFMAELNTAFKNGIINGMGDGTFGAGRNITRQDMAVILLNLAKRYGIDTNDAPKSEFKDYSNISEYATDAVNFLASNGIVNGTEGNMLPKRMATRAEAAKMIYEFIKVLDIENMSLSEENLASPEESGEAATQE